MVTTPAGTHARFPIDRPIGRRSFLTGCSAGLLAASGLGAPSRAETSTNGLKDHAARRGIAFGCMMMDREIADEPDLRAAVSREAAMIVPGVEMKWPANQPRPGPPDYAAADRLARFAADNELLLRGHTVLWYRSMPDWISKGLKGPGGEALMEERVRSVMGHFAGRVAEWDVVNEAIEPRDGNPGMFRSDPFYEGLGSGYVADAFHLAAGTDPKALLYYNDYGVEYVERDAQKRRDGMLALLTDLKKRNVPIDGFGIQAHLIPTFRFDEKVFRDFLAEVAALGLRISITEFDLNDALVKGDQKRRDRQIADCARQFLDVALDEKAVRTVLTWGLTNRSSWLNSFAPRKDGTLQRPLPLDADMKPNALWQAMASAFDHAPSRG